MQILMASRIISSFEAFSALVPDLVEKNSEKTRVEAVKRYFDRGGVVSIASTRQNNWPLVSYPSPLKLKNDISELQAIRQSLLAQQKGWKSKYSKAKFYEAASHVKKMSQPLYWKHMLKGAVDKDYRKDAEKVKLPIHLVSDPRWKPMVNMFVNNIDYRKQLTETVQHSVVYKKNRKLAKYSTDLQDFRMSVSERKVSSLSGKISEIDTDIKMLNIMMAMSRR